MEDQRGPVEQDETQRVTAVLEILETEAAADADDGITGEPDVIDTSDAASTTQTKKARPGKITTKPARTQEESPPNPLLLDPYEWDRCAITVGYSLQPNQQVTVSVHNHKDEPIVKEFPVEEIPLPKKISSVMATLQSIWPTSPVNATVVLLPRRENALERSIIASVRVSTDTPIVQEGVESDLDLPAPIIAMLEELKALMPERAMKNIEKNAKATTAVKIKPSNKSTTSKAAAPASAPAVNKNIDKSQLTLF